MPGEGGANLDRLQVRDQARGAGGRSVGEPHASKPVAPVGFAADQRGIQEAFGPFESEPLLELRRAEWRLPCREQQDGGKTWPFAAAEAQGDVDILAGQVDHAGRGLQADGDAGVRQLE